MDKAILILEEFLEPIQETLNAEQARRLLNYKVSPAMLTVLDDLATKSDAGTLTSEECAEYEALVETGEFIALMQATAREVLDRDRLT